MGLLYTKLTQHLQKELNKSEISVSSQSDELVKKKIHGTTHIHVTITKERKYLSCSNRIVMPKQKI